MHIVARKYLIGTVIPEAKGLSHAFAKPDTVHTVIARPPVAVLADTDSMESFVHDGSHLLIGAACSHAHTTAIAAVCRGGSGAIAYAQSHAVNTGQIVPIVIDRRTNDIV